MRGGGLKSPKVSSSLKPLEFQYYFAARSNEATMLNSLLDIPVHWLFAPHPQHFCCTVLWSSYADVVKTRQCRLWRVRAHMPSCRSNWTCSINAKTRLILRQCSRERRSKWFLGTTNTDTTLLGQSTFSRAGQKRRQTSVRWISVKALISWAVISGRGKGVPPWRLVHELHEDAPAYSLAQPSQKVISENVCVQVNLRGFNLTCCATIGSWWVSSIGVNVPSFCHIDSITIRNSAIWCPNSFCKEKGSNRKKYARLSQERLRHNVNTKQQVRFVSVKAERPQPSRDPVTWQSNARPPSRLTSPRGWPPPPLD